QNRHRPESVLRFMEEVLPMLDRLDFVERYAWFPATQDNSALGTSALFDKEDKLTKLGECYRDA
ncbi:MAG TPA: glycosyl hydrolase, partial [Luteolibacter sp.]|nr:glycosyl hydrolase [Luteolibacter sp.]